MHGSRQFIEMVAIEWNLEIKSLQLEMFNFTIISPVYIKESKRWSSNTGLKK